MKKLFYFITAIALQTILLLAKLLPAKIACLFLAKLCRFISPILPNNKLAKKNLALAFPQKNEREISLMVKNVWQNMALTLGEYLFLTHKLKVDLKNPDKSDVEIIGFEILEKIKQQKTPAIFFSAHIGNWELLPVGAAHFGVHIAVPFTMPKNPFVAKILTSRRAYGGEMIAAQFGLSLQLDKKLSDNKSIGILADQRYKKNAAKVMFFNRSASANPTIAILAKKHKCAIYPARCIRTAHGKFKVEIFDNINNDEPVDILTQKIHSIIENWIRDHPEQWMWPYNRWK